MQNELALFLHEIGIRRNRLFVFLHEAEKPMLILRVRPDILPERLSSPVEA